MSGGLDVAVGQSSHAGRKAENQDFYGAYLPQGAQRDSKGVAVALADGISTSEVGRVASETAVSAFLADYFCTSEAWSVKQSAQRVIMATNAWLHSLTRGGAEPFDREHGFVCTFSALVLKSTTAHLFHVGDARIYRLRGDTLEQISEDHRVWLSRNESYLGRALGVDRQVEIDYRALPLEGGDVFLLTTDGVYEHLPPAAMAATISRHGDHLDDAAKALVNEAYEQGSTDNLTAQLVRVTGLPEAGLEENQRRWADLPFPPALEAGAEFDGFQILRQIHASHRSHVYLARDMGSGTTVALKAPTAELKNDPLLLEKFLTEEWIARRINSPHVIRPCLTERPRNFTYIVMEFIEGQTLTQWMRDHPEPGLEPVRDIVEQVARGLRAFHRQEMVHQDIRPDNILIDESGTARIIDLGATRVAGLMDGRAGSEGEHMLGTEQYSAPEYFLGGAGTARADLFSLGVVAYQMLTGDLPYGTQVPRSRTRAAQNRLKYVPAWKHNRAIPGWLDATLRKAVHPNPERRYADVDEFAYDLRHPRKEFLSEDRRPLIERSPERFWQWVSLSLAGIIVALLVMR